MLWNERPLPPWHEKRPSQLSIGLILLRYDPVQQVPSRAEWWPKRRDQSVPVVHRAGSEVSVSVKHTGWSTFSVRAGATVSSTRRSARRAPENHIVNRIARRPLS